MNLEKLLREVYVHQLDYLIILMMGRICKNSEAERKRSLGKDYHPLCLKCFQCKRQLTAGQHAEYNDRPYCNNCYLLHFGPRAARGPASRNSYGREASTSSSTTTKENQSK